MIGRIEGQLVEISDNVVLVAVGGVAYEIEVTGTALARLPPRGNPVSFHTHFVVREDAQQLYGFASRTERDLFRTLIRISGIGPKLALALISSVSIDDLSFAVSARDTAFLTRVPGIGKKTAERLLVELAGKLPAVAVAEMPGAPRGAGNRIAATEAERALVSLGYRPAEALRAIEPFRDSAMSTEEIVRAALKQLARSAEATP
jgi:Holliday junction DNA helicase RuvA